MISPAPTLPPLLSGHRAVEKNPFPEACRRAASGELGAGDLVWAGSPGRVEAALVLEPEVEPVRAREMLLVAAVAASDAIGALAPPEVGLTWDWPATLRANDAVVGGVGIALSPGLDGKGAPDWLVVGLAVALKPDPDGTEPGHDPGRTTLYDEGCGEIGHAELLGAWARHLLTWVDTWQQEGFHPVGAAWTFRARGRGAQATVLRDGVSHHGRFIGLDDHGGLRLEGRDGPRTLALRDVDPA